MAKIAKTKISAMHALSKSTIEFRKFSIRVFIDGIELMDLRGLSTRAVLIDFSAS